MEKSKKTERIYVRCTAEHKSKIAEKAKLLNLNLSDFLLLATEKDVIIKEDIVSRKLLVEFSRIGNLLNQITAYANTYRDKAYNNILIDKIEKLSIKIDELKL